MESWTLDSLEMEVFENWKNLFDSAQANTARSPTSRSVSLRRVRLRAVLAWAELDSAQANTAWSQIFREYLSENELLIKKNHFSLFIRGPDVFDSWNKKMPKNLVTLPL